MPLTDNHGTDTEGLGKRSEDSQLTDVRVVVSGPEPPGWPVTGGQYQDREQRSRDSLEPRSGQQHPPVESLHRKRIKRIGAFLSFSLSLSPESRPRSRDNNLARRERAEYNRFPVIVITPRGYEARSRLHRREIVLRLAPYLRSA